MNNYKKHILFSLELDFSIRAPDLAIKVMGWIGPMNFNESEYNDALNDLIEKADIIPLYYTPMEGRTQIIFFSKGTSFSFNGNKI